MNQSEDILTKMRKKNKMNTKIKKKNRNQKNKLNNFRSISQKKEFKKNK